MSLYVLLPCWFLILQFYLCNSSYLNYSEALSKSIMFFEGQRSGYIPHNQRIAWRGNSETSVRSGVFTDLVGGYYEGGGNVKSSYPMAFTTTMLAWSVIEFGEMMPTEELRNTLVAIRWSADYLYRTAAQLYRIVVQVGNSTNDHNCWQRPEDLDTNWTVYMFQGGDPISDVAGETAAALAATSIAFRSIDPQYSETILKAAIGTFDYAEDEPQGSYAENVNIKYDVCPFYCPYDGYQDELLWGAAWLEKASKDERYLHYIQDHSDTLAGNENINEFGWDKKHAGLNVLVSKEVLEGKSYGLDTYKTSADNFICTLIPGSPSSRVTYTPGGLIYREGEKNLQHSTSITFLLLVYAKYLNQSSASVNCGNVTVGPTKLRAMAKRQVDYILGKNPKGMSYMVGYSHKYPQRIHHRGSSIPSITDHPQVISCKEGSVYFGSSNPNPNILIGAVVGGPQKDDEYEDDRADIEKSEPATYINAPFVGALAFFAANHKHHS